MTQVAVKIDTPILDAVGKLRTFWMTRDRINGVLMDVDVWAVQPDRVEHRDGDVIWLEPELAAIIRERIARGGDPVESEAIPLVVDENDSCVDSWSIVEAKRRYPGAPDTDRECVRCGPAPESIDRSKLS